jgi:hypothetical protein
MNTPEEMTSPESCGCAPAQEGSTIRSAVGWAIVAVACALAGLAYTTSALLWPVVFVVAWFGGYQTVYARGCGFGVEGSEASASAGTDSRALLDSRARTTRLRGGLLFLVVGAAVAALAIGFFAWLWPLAFLAAWFGTSFLVAAATRYPGCPEVGAIPSLVLGRPIVTRCPPLERIDRTLSPPH